MEDIDKELGFVTLVTGEIESRAFWAYLSVFPSKYEEFLDVNKSGQGYIMTDYGDILKFGMDEKEPAESIKNEMLTTYGIDTKFIKMIDEL